MVSVSKSYFDLFPQERQKLEGESRILLMTLPSIVSTEEEFALKVTMMSLSGMPDEGFVGRIRLRPSGPALEAPEHLDFRPEDNGRMLVSGLRVTEPGAYFLEAEVEGSPSPAPRSNPLLVQDSPATRLYWGDIHVHSVYGNCHRDYAKDPEFGYWYAREVSHLDFSAITDHLRGLDPDRWARLKELAKQYNEPGRFVTFLGFESSHSKDHGGDINVYYLGEDADYFWIDREDMKGISPKVGLDVLWKWLDEQGVPYVVIPHHTGRAGKFRDFDLPYYNRNGESLLEIFSMWGSSEARHDGFFLRGGKTDHRAYFQDALGLGYRYGVVASSDTHHTMPGTPCSALPQPYHHPPNKMMNQGLAAVYSQGLERKPLFEALLKRRCYATTSTRPILSFSVNSVKMGGKVIAGPADLWERRVEVDLCTSIFPASIEVLRNNEVIDTLRVTDDVHTRHSLIDDLEPDELWIKGAPRNENPFFYYYVRVRFSGNHDGITAWSSPIWVEKE